MTVKSIIDVDVNAGAFTAFQRTYNEYSRRLKDDSKNWDSVQDKIKGGAAGFRTLVNEIVAAQARTKLIAIAQAQAARETRTMADNWKDISSASKNALTNIVGISSNLVRWTAVGGVLSTLAGIGGIFGIDRFAAGISSQRRQSLGTGTSFGELRAFQTNFSRLVDPDTFLSGVNAALHGDRSGLFGGGLNKGQLGGGSAQVGTALLRSLKKLADETPEDQLNFVHQGRRLGQFLSPEQFQALRATKGPEFESLLRSYGSDKSALGAGGDTLLKWQDFSTQLGRAGQKIETVFINGLEPLIGPLKELSGTVADTLKAFLEAPQIKTWMKDLGSGLETLAKFVGTPQFAKDVETFATGLGVLAGKIARFVKWFGGGEDAPGGVTPKGSSDEAAGVKYTNIFGGPRGLVGGPSVKLGSGALDQGLSRLAAWLQGSVSGVGPVTAGNDAFHKNRISAHNDDRAFDLRLNDPSQSAAIAQKIRDEMQRLGIQGKVIDEYKNPSQGATGGHLHVQTDRRVDVHIFDATGGNNIVTANQAAQAP